MGLTETEQAIFAADAAFPAFAALPGRVRGRMIMEMDRLFVQAKRDLAQIAVLECGKSLAEAEGEVVVGCEREVDAEGQF
jgi:acyl-CoA reductase-like NAD-dependent aldehyde dehydrogenase